MEEDGWSEPINMGHPINSIHDEFYPNMVVGEQKFYFSRTNPNEDLRRPRRAPDCKIFYAAFKDLDGRWGTPLPLHDAINMGCVYSLNMNNDGQTLFFSAIDPENHREGYNIYFTREIFSGAWMLPSLITELSSDETNINPEVVDGKIYFLRQVEGRRETTGSIYRATLPGNYLPYPTVSTKGHILKLDSKNPIIADLTVFDPTTLTVAGVFNTSDIDGQFEILMPDNRDYIVDVRKPGYSFASFDLDFREDEKILAPDTIMLFDRIDLILSVFDEEIFRPLEADVWVEVITDISKEAMEELFGEEAGPDGVLRVYADQHEPGIYIFSLPLNIQYQIKVRANGFVESGFDFNLTDDIVFSEFHRRILLKPIRREIEFYIADSETQEGVAAEIVITNLNREETIFFSAQDVKDGKVTAMLREGDEYEFTVRGAEGYSFHNQTFNLSDDKEETQELEVELIPLRAETSIRLNNIYFGTNSAELTSESFAELDRVVDLLESNPLIVIEVSAHTDDVGSDSYNLVLSERRAQTVVSYLLDNDVPKDRLIAKGYGLRRPIVPNECDETRALNRRVEFKIIDIREASTDN